MARRTSRKQTLARSQRKEPQTHWWSWMTSPLAQQTLAVLLIVLALVTLLGLTNLPFTSGYLIDAWVGAVRFLFGWGIIPVATAIGVTGILILLHHLDRPVTLRWRPIVGLELLFFSLLGLTHLLIGQADPWGLVESGWGGGLIGWAMSHVLSLYVGAPITGLLFLVALVVGIAFGFDLTWQDGLGWIRRARAGRQRPQARPAPPPSPAVPSRQHAARRTVRRTAEQPAPPPPPATRPAPARPVATSPTKPEPIPLAAAVELGELQFPSLDLLAEAEEPGLSDAEVREKSRIIRETLSQFGLPVEVVEVRRGPTVTQFGIAPGFTERAGPNGQRRRHKVRVSQIASLADDLALALAAPSLRVEAPVPGRSVVGIEVPNEEIGLVTLRAVMESDVFKAMHTPLAIALGEDVAGSPVVTDLGLMPHLLIAGTTGSGKSVCIKAMATCLALTNRPDELRFVMIDPKMVELVRFNGLPHLLGHTEVELERITRVLRWVAQEMDGRYKKFAAISARNLDDYNNKVNRRSPEKRLPRIIVFIDELADLMMLAPEETERTICRIAQMARATGIHLVVATQRPSTDVVTGLIKANFPARISFATASQIDSRVILDMPGAETLLGRGDMLYLAADAGYPVRVQGCFVSENEVERIVSFWRAQTPQWSSEPPWEQMMHGPAGGEGTTSTGGEEDELLQQAIQLLQKRQTVSASYLQRRLRIGYPRAARLMEELEGMGLVGPPEAAGRPRRVIGGEGD